MTMLSDESPGTGVMTTDAALVPKCDATAATVTDEIINSQCAGS
nr:hypothetical protein [Microbacterium resistens]